MAGNQTGCYGQHHRPVVRTNGVLYTWPDTAGQTHALIYCHGLHRRSVALSNRLCNGRQHRPDEFLKQKDEFLKQKEQSRELRMSKAEKRVVAAIDAGNIEEVTAFYNTQASGICSNWLSCRHLRPGARFNLLVWPTLQASGTL